MGSLLAPQNVSIRLKGRSREAREGVASGLYGTIAYRHLVQSQMIMRSVVPISLTSEFIDTTSMDEDEVEEFVARRTVRNSRGLPANAIVSCGDMHREDDDDVEIPFLCKGKGSPTNVILKAQQASNRNRRQVPVDTNETPTDELNDEVLSREKRVVPNLSTTDEPTTEDMLKGSTDNIAFNYGTQAPTSAIPMPAPDQKVDAYRDRINNITYSSSFNPEK